MDYVVLPHIYAFSHKTKKKGKKKGWQPEAKQSQMHWWKKNRTVLNIQAKDNDKRVKTSKH